MTTLDPETDRFDGVDNVARQDSFFFGIFDSMPTLFTFQIGMSESIKKRTLICLKPYSIPCRVSKVIDINLRDSDIFFDVVIKGGSC